MPALRCLTAASMSSHCGSSCLPAAIMFAQCRLRRQSRGTDALRVPQSASLAQPRELALQGGEAIDEVEDHGDAVEVDAEVSA